MESGGDLKTTLLDKSPTSPKDSSGGARLHDIPLPRPTRSQYFWSYARRLAIMAIPVYTLEVVLLEVRGILEDKDDNWAEEQFLLNFISPFIFTMIFSVMIVDDLAFEYLYHRCLEYGLMPRLERKPAYTAQLVWLIGLLGFGSCGVIGYFVNPRQGGIIGLQALQLIVVYYSSFYRERDVFPLSQLFGQSDTDFAQSQAMLQKFVPITERQLTALCVHKRRIYDKVRRGLCCPDENYVKKNFKAAAGDLYDFSSFQRRLAANPGLPNTCAAKCNPGNHLWAYNAMVTTELFTDAHDQQMSKFINLLMWLSLAFVLACQATTGALFGLLHRSGWDWDL